MNDFGFAEMRLASKGTIMPGLRVIAWRQYPCENHFIIRGGFHSMIVREAAAVLWRVKPGVNRGFLNKF